MNLLSSEVHWLFLTGSSEERFLNDICFGIQSLLSKGVSPEKIKVVADINTPLIAGLIVPVDLPDDIELFETASFDSLVLKLNSKYLVIIVTGHGNSSGIALHNGNISPNSLISILRKSTSLEKTLIVLGQCFAGIFNYLEAKKVDNLSGKPIFPEICFLGATNLDVSVSALVDISKGNITKDFQCNQSWIANVFLFYFFQYIVNPLDIDGDGKFTVTDSYKYAGIETNSHLMSRRIPNLFHAIKTITSEMIKSSDTQKWKKQSLIDLENTLIIALVNQNPWILNAHFSRTLEINSATIMK